ncbi:Uncharacterised protein [Legionella lansingensis]|uniref:Uncharacterized protein n=1 Tax=Legionella lansingensis TaxID=45067 RepID=A0A0W0VZ51_9GAMM|nr:hypothetical protein [Legionella lansingensis]KTD25388.1 hypothetical protein Llan_0134 [Legionella lansingensis]SNV51330.1 Uncharacterised protein [Legionella lansingensis]
MGKSKKLEAFISENILDKSGGHIARVYKKRPKDKVKPGSKRNEKIWFIKAAYSPHEPLELEVISGELYRFWVGNTQPKTRLVIDQNGARYVASEGVPGFKTFKSIIEAKGDKLPDLPDYKTLARILVSSMVLAETDLKSDNIAFNNEGRIVKIDHDSSLWPIVVETMSIQHDLNKVTFSAADLDNILFPPNYKVDAWAGGLPKEIRETIAANPEFQKEVYLQMVRMLVSPPHLLSTIQSVNAPNDLDLENKIQGFITQRLTHLRIEAMKSEGFRSFVAQMNIQEIELQLQQELTDYLGDNKPYDSKELDSFSIYDALQDIKNNAEELSKINLLKNQIKLDSQNREHLEYWQKKTTYVLGVGGKIMTLEGKEYRVPTSVAQMMALATTSYEEYKNQIDQIRKIMPQTGFKFFESIKNKLLRDKTTESLHTTENIEDIVLDTDPQSTIVSPPGKT